MKKIIFLFAVIISTLTSCVSVKKTFLTSDTKKYADKKIDIYVTSLPNRKYKEVAYLEAFGSAYHQKKHCYRKLVQKAKELDADAVINVRFHYTNFFWYIYSQVDAVAIKYID